MKPFAEGMLARKKIVLIFVLAILLPALIVGTMSLSAFAKRREAVKRILESNLWISSESALRTVETALLEHEKKALQTENFARLSGPESPGLPGDQQSTGGAAHSAHFPGTPFLLDGEYRIVFPKTGSERPSISTSEETAPESEFSKAFRRAEALEFSQKNFARAAQDYRESSAHAPSNREKAMALESLGRCLISAGNLNEARRAYVELDEKYGRIQDRAGHFFGLTAAFQIHEIEKRRQQAEAGLRVLLDLYQGLKDGNWPVSLPEYEFFTTEIQSLIETGLPAGGAAEIGKAYRGLKEGPSPYLEALIFTEFLKREVMPKIKERMGVSSFRGSPQLQPDRLLAHRGEDYCLVSYSPLPDFDERRTYYGGFCWNLESLEKSLLPEILAAISKETGLELANIEENRAGSPAAAGEGPTAKDSLSLPYRQFPLPWKLLVTQPALDELERTAHRENFLYGTLLAFIVVLMLLGAFLLGRDISRETETTRLKTEFVHNISHELKTPLTLIRLYGETLQRKENLTDDERRESYEIITKESERLSHLINNVLDFSRIDMGRKEFTFTKGSLSQVVKATLDSYRYHLEKKGFALREDIAPDLPEMNFDREAVASALINLLSNAMKFSPAAKEVTVKLFRRDTVAVLQVADKGIGISQQDLSGIFKRFYRAKNSLVSETRGSGLGLTLVKHTADAHGGTVEVESEPGKGSVFSIIMPISGPEAGEAK
jgi:signal transduction histidine kinase/tetratricopeptide (TPR) repeat protein